MSILQIETLAYNVASSFDINYLDVLSKTGITQEIHLVAIEKLLQTINVELTNSKTLDTLDTIWRLMWEPNFADDIGGDLTHGKYYYLCINNCRLKCIRDKTVELYNMNQTNSDKKNGSKAPVETPVVNVEEPKVVVEVAAPVVSEKKKKSGKSTVVAETPATEGEVAPVVTAEVSSEKKKRAPAKKKEPVVPSTEGEVAPVVVTTEVSSEKKKRAPAKKKEPVTTIVPPATEGGEVAPVVVVSEKKKRAPAKKKEPVTTTIVTVETEPTV